MAMGEGQSDRRDRHLRAKYAMRRVASKGTLFQGDPWHCRLGRRPGKLLLAMERSSPLQDVEEREPLAVLATAP